MTWIGYIAGFSTLLEKKVLSGTKKGSSALPIEKLFEEPLLVPGRNFLVPGRTFVGSMWNPFHRGFYLEHKRVLPGTKKGSNWNQKELSFGESCRTLSEPIFLRVYGYGC